MQETVKPDQALLRFVAKVRSAMEDLQVKNSHVSFHNFPSGSCMDASILLGKLMIKFGFGDFQVIGTNWEILPTHSWLQNEHWIIDMTADQFSHWPKQNLIIARHPLPDHYSVYGIASEEPASQKAFPFGTAKAYSLIQEILNT